MSFEVSTVLILSYETLCEGCRSLPRAPIISGVVLMIVVVPIAGELVALGTAMGVPHSIPLPSLVPLALRLYIRSG